MNKAPVNLPTVQTAGVAAVSPLFALVETYQLRRSYWQAGQEIIALAEATCSLRPNDRIALVGRSGSGKSTLLHLLGGLDTPTGGTITWPALGERETLRPAKIALVFQTQSLLPPLTVLENVELPLLLSRASAAAARATALEALTRLELDYLADKLPEELSGGQAQRVALARALAYRPPLILADEPTGQLDRPTAQHLFDVLLAALKESRTALVVATHDLGVAERLTTRWLIERGILQGATL